MSNALSPELEIFIGRSLAFCAHPLTAWRILSRLGRVLIVLAYFLAAFVTIFTALLALAPTTPL